MTGHLLGAAGAVEAIFTAMALVEGYLPATIGYQVPDPACDLDIVPNQGRKADIKAALSNSLGFGGHNACIVLKKVDKIVDCVPGQSAVGRKCVTANEPFFQGHFPGFKVMPGVLIIEALAQVGAVAILTEEGNQGKLALFGGIKNARFKQQVRPGDVLELSCQLTARRGPVGFGTAEARVDGKLACKAELTFALTDKPE